MFIYLSFILNSFINFFIDLFSFFIYSITFNKRRGSHHQAKRHNLKKSPVYSLRYTMNYEY